MAELDEISVRIVHPTRGQITVLRSKWEAGGYPDFSLVGEGGDEDADPDPASQDGANEEE